MTQGSIVVNTSALAEKLSLTANEDLEPGDRLIKSAWTPPLANIIKLINVRYSTRSFIPSHQNGAAAACKGAADVKVIAGDRENPGESFGTCEGHGIACIRREKPVQIYHVIVTPNYPFYIFN